MQRITAVTESHPSHIISMAVLQHAQVNNNLSVESVPYIQSYEISINLLYLHKIAKNHLL